MTKLLNRFGIVSLLISGSLVFCHAANAFDIAGDGGGGGNAPQISFERGKEGIHVTIANAQAHFEQEAPGARRDTDTTSGKPIWIVNVAQIQGATACLKGIRSDYVGSANLGEVDCEHALATLRVEGDKLTGVIPWRPEMDRDGDGTYWQGMVFVLATPTLGQAWVHHPGFVTRDGKLVATGQYAAFMGGKPLTLVGMKHTADGTVTPITPTAAVKAELAKLK